MRLNWISLLLMGLVIIVYFMFWGKTSPKEITWNLFEQTMLKEGDVAKVDVINKEIAEVYIRPERLNQDKYEEIRTKGLFRSPNPGPHYQFNIGSIESFENKLASAERDIPPEERIEIVYSSRSNWIGVLFSWLLPIGLMILFWVMMTRGTSVMRGAGNIFDFGKSTARLQDEANKSKITFDDVAGLKEAKIEVMEIVDFLKNPENYTRLGAKIPKGVILVGPPGTGKTLLAKAVAGEAQVPFFSLSGSEFVEMFVGVGASRVRDLFRRAKEKSPSIIFIDEIDAIGRSRGNVHSFQSNDERESTLNQLLTELDGFGPNTGVIVLAATNRADILDRALLRPGRFDRHIYLELPDLSERKEIFKVHLRPLKLNKNIDIDLLAGQTPGFSGADIANICNEAALIAARKNKDEINRDDFMEATERIIGGLEKKSKIISTEEKKVIAYHEAGHAAASWLLEHVAPPVKVSIIPRGKSLGAAWYLPEEHQIVTRSEFFDQICAALGGRASEKIFFNEISSGALDDLEKVTKLAYNMVSFYGLDESIGNTSFYDSTGAYNQALVKPYSEETAKLIDKGVREIIENAYKATEDILQANKEKVASLAELLLKKEVVSGEEIEKIFGKRKTRIQSEEVTHY